MPDIQRQCLFFFGLLAYLFCFVSFPVSVYPQNLQSTVPPSLYGNTSDGASQKNEIESLLAKFNGCAWYKTPGDPSRDIYLELKDRTLILFEYFKDGYYCSFIFRICFAQEELWRVKVTGYDMTFTDQHGNTYRIVINRDGKTITIQSIGSTGDWEYIIGTFVKLFCSENI
jgi:hypothetical protein